MKFSAVLYLFTLASVSAAAAIDPSSGQGADGTLAKRSSGRKSESTRIAGRARMMRQTSPVKEGARKESRMKAMPEKNKKKQKTSR
ncbi:hypothetical protein MCOR24_011394 [Pyricularia oryzae]|nr:hypothetical protein MCOR24_011394 [Pyricularia oryzae]